MGKRKAYLPAVTADEFNLRINFHFLSSSHNDYGRVLNDNVLLRFSNEALQDYPTLLIKTGIVANAIEYHFTINWFEMNF